VVKLGGKGSGIAIRPVAAGHMIGGAIWHITKVTAGVRVRVRARSGTSPR
jgi:Cft2 family RNA processing exonuclease